MAHLVPTVHPAALLRGGKPISDIIISDLKVIGHNDNSKTAAYGIELRNVTRFAIERVFVQNSGTFAIMPRLSTDGRVSGCRVDTSKSIQDGIHPIDSDRLVIEGNVIYTDGDDCLAVTADHRDCADVVFANNVCRSAGGANAYGVKLSTKNGNTLSRVSITGNVITDCDRGIGLAVSGSSYVKHVLIDGNHILDPDEDGIEFEDDGLSDVTISNNYIYSSGAAGIRCYGQNNLVIRSNTIYQAGNFGIICYDNTNLQINDNLIFEAGAVTANREGIRIGEAGHPTTTFTCNGNVIEKASGHGIEILRSSDGTIRGNVVKNSQNGAGIRLAGDVTNPVADIVITGNRCFDDQQDADLRRIGRGYDRLLTCDWQRSAR